MKFEKTGTLTLPNGCTLYWEPNEVGGYSFSSDEIGGGVHVWDTALVDSSTLYAAMMVAAALERSSLHGK